MVDHLPHVKVIGNLWVYRTKEKVDGTLDKCKTQLITHGCLQIHGLDFIETFSPNIKFTTICIVMSIVLHFNWEIKKLTCVNYQVFSMPRIQQKFINFTRKSLGLSKLQKHSSINYSYAFCLGFFLVLIVIFTYFPRDLIRNSCLFLSISMTLFFKISNHPSLQAFVTSLRDKFSLKDMGSLKFSLGIQVTRTSQDLHL